MTRKVQSWHIFSILLSTDLSEKLFCCRYLLRVLNILNPLEELDKIFFVLTSQQTLKIKQFQRSIKPANISKLIFHIIESIDIYLTARGVAL